MILNFFDKLIGLAKERKSNRRELFHDFVDPAFEDFKTVHNNYKDTFQKVITHIEEKEDPSVGDAIQKMIESDALNFREDRLELLAFTKQNKISGIDNFIRAIVYHLEVPLKVHDFYSGFETYQKSLVEMPHNFYGY